MTEVGPGAPELRVDWRLAPPDTRPSTVCDEWADVRLLGGARLRMTRLEPHANFSGPRNPPAADLLHPWLAPAAALWWHWEGALPIHAGAWQAGAGAVLLLAAKEGGKTTTLAWLADHGHPVVADDLAVVRDGWVLPGPRLLDVRPGPLDATAPVPGHPRVRAGERVRLNPAGPAAELAVVGIVALAWATETSLQPVPPSERLKVLAGQRMVPSLCPPARGLLDLLAVPMMILRRPRGSEGLMAAGRALAGYFT